MSCQSQMLLRGPAKGKGAILATYGRNVVTHIARIRSRYDCGKSLSLEAVAAGCLLACKGSCSCREGTHCEIGDRLDRWTRR